MQHFDRFTKEAQEAISNSAVNLQRSRHNLINTTHILLGLIEKPGSIASQIFTNFNVDIPTMRNRLREILSEAPEKNTYGENPDEIYITPKLKQIVDLSAEASTVLCDDQVSSGHILWAIFSDEPIARVLEEFKVTPEQVYAELQKIHLKNSLHNLRVFLCHSSEDKPRVRNLYHRLRAEGVNPWLDEKDLLPGQDWQTEIRKAVRDSEVVLVCLSKRSITKTGYVQKEIKQALDVADEQPEGTIFIIPLRLEDCEVPERLSKWQWVDLYADDGYHRLV